MKVDVGHSNFLCLLGKKNPGPTLKALCHAISADCLLIEAACAHVVNEHWVWQMADKFMYTFKSVR